MPRFPLLLSAITAGLLTCGGLPGQTPARKPAAHAPVKRKPAAAATLTTDDQKTIYALGISVAHSLDAFNLSPAELAIVARALSDSAAGKPAIDVEVWQPKIATLKNARAAVAAEKRKVAAQAYVAKAAAAPGAVKTDSGIIYRDITAGTGPSPAATDTVKVQYRGTFLDGTEFDSSYKRNEPATFPLNQVIKCWTEGLQKMKVGGKANLVCPPDMAYGDAGRQSIPGGSTLIFDVELLEIVGGK